MVLGAYRIFQNCTGGQNDFNKVDLLYEIRKQTIENAFRGGEFGISEKEIRKLKGLGAYRIKFRSVGRFGGKSRLKYTAMRGKY